MRARKRIPFHIPGHKRGKGMDPEFRDFLGDNVLAIDLINIAPVDDLHHPQGMIKEAQELAARAFGSRSHLFLGARYERRQPGHDPGRRGAGR